MTIRIGDYVHIKDSDDYGTVVDAASALDDDEGDIVQVRLESGVESFYEVSHVEVIARPVENVRFDSPVSKEAWAKAFDDAMRAEVRQTSDSGAQKGSKLARYDMIPADALKILAEHYGKGAEKYPPLDNGDGFKTDNWRRGYDWSLSFAAMQRHSWQFWNGEDIDPETGSPHLAAVAWHALAMLHWSLNDELKEKYDDRPRI